MAYLRLRHFGLKFLSVGLAALIWLLVSGEQIVERALRIPLEFTNLPSQLEIVGDPPTVVDVRIRGSSGALSRIATGELVALLDLRSARAGQRLFHLTNSDVRAPFGIDVVQITPSNVPVRLETAVTKIVPVVPGVDGVPREGYTVGTITADPPTVQVRGPATAVSKLTEAITEQVSVAGASKAVTESVNVGVADPSVHLASSARAKVTVDVVPAPTEWTVADIPVRSRETAGSIQIAPAKVTLYVRGARVPITSEDSFEASIDTEGLEAGLFNLPVRVTSPPHASVIRVDPPTVRVRIR